MAPKIYTRKGDDGSTGLLYGGRVGKDSAGPDAYGAVDEAVSMLGLARAETERGSELDELLIRLQRELFVVGAELATAPANRAKLEPGVSLTTDGDGRGARTGHRRRHHALRHRRPSSCSRARTASPPRSTWPARSSGVPSAARSPRPVTAGSPDSQVVPYLNRLADLVYTLARWQEGTFRPVRADRST